ncbi:MAG: ABC transporter ATP-binding protein [Saprospiraceae bacterium]|nr:ABC transporter ATP-binding protein [Saprospiraceae bacterium]
MTTSTRNKAKKPGLVESTRSLRYLPRFFQMIWNTSNLLFVANVGSRLVKSVLPVLMLWLGKLIIDEVVVQMSMEAPIYSRIWWLLGWELFLAIISDVLNRGITLFDTLLGDLYANKSSIELIEQAAKMDLAQFEDPEFYDKLERARRQTTGRVSLMTMVLGQLQDIITVLSLITGLIVFEPWLVILLLFAIIPSFLNEAHFSRSSYSLVRSWTPERRKLDYLRYIGASDATAKEIKLFGLSSFLASRFRKLADKYYQANRKLAIRRTVWGSVYHIIGDCAYYGAYILIILRTVGGLLTLGDLTFLSGSFSRLRNQLQSIFSRFSRITEYALYLQDYFSFMDIEANMHINEGNKPMPPIIRAGFTFDKVGFKYPGSDEWAVRNISFTLRAGEKLALVGENGAGKTTLVKLLARLYDPNEGNIFLDGINIKEYDLAQYRYAIGVIFQDYVRYYFTAADNISIGDISKINDQDQIEMAAVNSLADPVIQGLPKKYEQVLGKRFAEGKDLSGGEWQKVALARAYMKDAKLLILDEPTATLDARAEFQAFERFAELTTGKTAVIISHRFSTVRMANRILVLKHGEILELGTHQQLLDQEGLYAELFQLQAAGYQ